MQRSLEPDQLCNWLEWSEPLFSPWCWTIPAKICFFSIVCIILCKIHTFLFQFQRQHSPHIGFSSNFTCSSVADDILRLQGEGHLHAQLQFFQSGVTSIVDIWQLSKSVNSFNSVHFLARFFILKPSMPQNTDRTGALHFCSAWKCRVQNAVQKRMEFQYWPVLKRDAERKKDSPLVRVKKQACFRWRGFYQTHQQTNLTGKQKLEVLTLTNMSASSVRQRKHLVVLLACLEALDITFHWLVCWWVCQHARCVLHAGQTSRFPPCESLTPFVIQLNLTPFFYFTEFLLSTQLWDKKCSQNTKSLETLCLE